MLRGARGRVRGALRRTPGAGAFSRKAYPRCLHEPCCLRSFGDSPFSAFPRPDHRRCPLNPHFRAGVCVPSRDDCGARQLSPVPPASCSFVECRAAARFPAHAAANAGAKGLPARMPAKRRRLPRAPAATARERAAKTNFFSSVRASSGSLPAVREAPGLAERPGPAERGPYCGEGPLLSGTILPRPANDRPVMPGRAPCSPAGRPVFGPHQKNLHRMVGSQNQL